MDHPSSAELFRYANRGTSPEVKKNVEGHLRECSSCVLLVATMRGDLAVAEATAKTNPTVPELYRALRGTALQEWR